MIEDLRNVLSFNEGLGKVMGDVLRVLYLCMGSLWFPELIMELRGFRETLGEEAPSSDEVKRAVNELAKLGLIEMRRGIRATFYREGEETYLISVRRTPEILSELLRDERVRRYRDIWKQVFER